MMNLFLGVYTIIRWLVIACVLPIWYIGALQTNSLNSVDEVVLGFASIIWILAAAIIIFGS